MSQKIGGCVVLFNPALQVIDNIATYHTNLDLLIIIDNSPNQNEDLIDEIKNPGGAVIYQWLGENKGIAKALNIACEIAMKQNCEWLLTMDQDSKFREGDLLKMIESIDSIKLTYRNTGVISPCHHVHKQFFSKSNKLFVKIRSTMTSGNLLNLRIHRKLSGFEEKLFIDYVDHEYCLRLRKNNFMIIQNSEILLDHSLGEFAVKTFLEKKIGTSNHNYNRRYYIARNGMYTVKKYFFFDTVFCWKIIKNILYDFGRILLFEKDKYLKIKAMAIGIYHFIVNRYGKYEQGL